MERISPTMHHVATSEDPPYETNGSVMPVVGMTPTFIATFTSAWAAMLRMRSRTSIAPPRSRASRRRARARPGREAGPVRRPRLPPLAKKAAGADRDPRLPYLVAGTARREVRVEERADPVLLVILQEEPRAADRERPAHDEDGPPAPRDSAEEEGRGEKRQVREREAQIRLKEDEDDRHADGRADRGDRARTQERAVVVLEDPCEEKRDRDARELRRLELKAAAHLEPRLRPGNPLAEDREQEKHEERESVKTRRVLQEDAVVDREEDAGGDEAEDREKNLLAGEISARSSEFLATAPGKLLMRGLTGT